MQTVLRIASVEIVPATELSSYNYQVYAFNYKNQYGVTHLVEVYDDVSDEPAFRLGVYEDGKFQCMMSGVGDPVPENKFSCGGVFFDVELM